MDQTIKAYPMTKFMESIVVNSTRPKAPLDGRMTKIICTIGPASQSVEKLSELLEAGMNVARMNFSHGDHQYHAQTIKNVRNASKNTGIPVAIMLDTKGPEIRTTKLKDHKPILLSAGKPLSIKSTTDTLFEGDENCIGCDYMNLPKVIKEGDIIKIDDGLISCIVTGVSGDVVETVVKNAGELGETKGINLPNVVVDLPALTMKDKKDLLFGVDNNIDLIAASFARKAQDIHDIRALLGEKGRTIRIISKIESVEGLDNFDEILQASDGIMVARGDLGVEIPIQKVAMAQKMMIRKCNIAGKPVVTATQMLESMVKNPRPTRAEATDVANAVFDGSDCVMLSGETAKGQYPVAAVETMARICKSTESTINAESAFDSIFPSIGRPLSRPEAISSAAVNTVSSMRAALILVLTESGASARYVAKYKPSVPIITMTSDEQTFRQLLVSRAVWPVMTSSSKGDEELLEEGIAMAKSNSWVKTDDWVVVVSGTQGISGSAHTLKVVQVQ